MLRPIDIRFLVVHAILTVSAYLLCRHYLPIDPRWLLLLAPTMSAFALMAFDKFAATQGWGRVSERAFAFTAFLGGSLGVLLGMYVFRHKTRKVSFQLALAFVFLVQVGLVTWYLQQGRATSY